jgi:hypothetical protein
LANARPAAQAAVSRFLQIDLAHQAAQRQFADTVLAPATQQLGTFGAQADQAQAALGVFARHARCAALAHRQVADALPVGRDDTLGDGCRVVVLLVFERGQDRQHGGPGSAAAGAVLGGALAAFAWQRQLAQCMRQCTGGQHQSQHDDTGGQQDGDVARRINACR